MRILTGMVRRVGPIVCVSSLILDACGGGGGASTPVTYTIGGTVSGLSSGSQIALLNNGGNSISVTANGAFTFDKTLLSTNSYAVTVGTAPAGESCSVSSGSGTVGSADITDVAVTCVASRAIGGMVSGLNSGARVVLLDNGGNALTVAASGSFVFTSPLATGTAYAVTVGTPPTGETCTLTNGSGTVAASDITNIAVACSESISDSKLLLELGHVQSIVDIQMAGTRALSEDNFGHWVLWDLASDAEIANGTSSCLSSLCTTSHVLIAQAGSTAVLETASGLGVHATSDGHVLATIPGPMAWWKLASDGTYVVTGSAQRRFRRGRLPGKVCIRGRETTRRL